MEIKLIILSLALLLDRFVGDPPQLWQKVPHPVVLFGKAISWGEKRWNNRNLSASVLRRNGMWLTIGLVMACVVLGLVLNSRYPSPGLPVQLPKS